MNALHELEQADRLGHRLRQWMVDLLRIAAIFAADLGGDVAFDEVVDLVEPGERLRRAGLRG